MTPTGPTTRRLPIGWAVAIRYAVLGLSSLMLSTYDADLRPIAPSIALWALSAGLLGYFAPARARAVRRGSAGLAIAAACYLGAGLVLGSADYGVPLGVALIACAAAVGAVAARVGFAARSPRVRPVAAAAAAGAFIAEPAVLWSGWNGWNGWNEPAGGYPVVLGVIAAVAVQCCVMRANPGRLKAAVLMAPRGMTDRPRGRITAAVLVIPFAVLLAWLLRWALGVLGGALG
ncbi:hypothetical protein ACFZB9_19295 [Kitasatospora sp. NPDC008050]|uniref:hypothetical protein n=1 Tax=Kitasatospora sp. NPDC008050 TaxID=3364021 RepID=UPI0036E22DC5